MRKMLNVSGSYLLADCVCVLSRALLFGSPRTIAHQAPLSMEFSRQEYWIGLPFPSPEDLPDPGTQSTPLEPQLAGAFLITAPPGKPFGRRADRET